MESNSDNPAEMQDVFSIYRAALGAVDTSEIIMRSLQLRGDTLIVHTPDSGSREYDLRRYARIYLIGYGKASAQMAAEAEKILGKRISKGIIVTKYGHGTELRYCELLEAGHPIPDKESYRAGKKISELCRNADAGTLFITLVSGGGSALLEYSPLVSLERMQDITGLLLASGADIHTLNTVRSALSGVKAGKLARLMHPAQSITLIISDVLDNDPAVIASGPTVYCPPANTARAEEMLRRYVGIELAELQEQRGKENIKQVSDSEIFSSVWNCILASNYQALRAAEEQANILGYSSLLLSSRLYGEARELAKVYLAIAASINERNIPRTIPACIIGGGESTVHVQGSGKGGRNLEMALSFAHESLQDYHRSWMNTADICFLSAGTDGSDGPTNAAGAYLSSRILRHCRQSGLLTGEYLSNNDSYSFFAKIGSLYNTGPTGTNVCDVQILTVGYPNRRKP